jgi:hypothetical protein
MGLFPEGVHDPDTGRQLSFEIQAVVESYHMIGKSSHMLAGGFAPKIIFILNYWLLLPK